MKPTTRSCGAGEVEAVVFVPPPRPPLPSKQLLSSPRQGSEGIGGVAPQEHLAPVNTRWGIDTRVV